MALRMGDVIRGFKRYATNPDAVEMLPTIFSEALNDAERCQIPNVNWQLQRAIVMGILKGKSLMDLNEDPLEDPSRNIHDFFELVVTDGGFTEQEAKDFRAVAEKWVNDNRGRINTLNIPKLWENAQIEHSMDHANAHI